MTELFWAHVHKTDDCWLWTGKLMRNGYGCYGKPSRAAHRVAYEAERGPIPSGLDLDHLCRTRNCVRPSHLEPVTRGENLRRSELTGPGKNSRKTHCWRGHDLAVHASIVVTKAGIRKRQCRLCASLRRTGQCPICGKTFVRLRQHRAATIGPCSWNPRPPKPNAGQFKAGPRA